MRVQLMRFEYGYASHPNIHRHVFVRCFFHLAPKHLDMLNQNDYPLPLCLFMMPFKEFLPTDYVQGAVVVLENSICKQS